MSAAGTPLPHAQVRLTAFGQEVRAPPRAMAMGGFEFKDVPFGVSALEVSATGYATEQARRDGRCQRAPPW